MRHLKKGRKFSRLRSQRKSLIRNLAFSLVMQGRIKTTEAKAKELRPHVEKLITIAKGATIASRRLLAQRVPSRAVTKLVGVLAPRFSNRHGGYLRIVKLGTRTSDAAREALIEFMP